MPKIVNGLPKYRRHSSRDKAFVVLNGKRVYLPGPYKSQESRKEYRRLLLEWEVQGRPDEPIPAPNDITVAELGAKFWKHAKRHYVKNGMSTGTADNYKPALKLLKDYYGDTSAVEFGPLALKSLRSMMVKVGNSRRYVNDNASRICKVFRWGASEQLVSSTVWNELRAVEGLEKGRSDARETAPIQPVDDAVVDATLDHLPAVVADMVRFQRLVGCRSGEVCQVRPCDVDTKGDVWSYIPAEHKTEHHGHERIIFIGDRAQTILRPYLLREKTSRCFSPRDSERKRRAKQHEERTSYLSCGNIPGSNRVRHPKREATDSYTNDSYRRAIKRACELAFPPPKGLTEKQAKQWRKDHAWHPHQLRHTTDQIDGWHLNAASPQLDSYLPKLVGTIPIEVQNAYLLKEQLVDALQNQRWIRAIVCPDEQFGQSNARCIQAT